MSQTKGLHDYRNIFQTSWRSSGCSVCHNHIKTILNHPIRLGLQWNPVSSAPVTVKLTVGPRYVYNWAMHHNSMATHQRQRLHSVTWVTADVAPSTSPLLSFIASVLCHTPTVASCLLVFLNVIRRWKRGGHTLWFSELHVKPDTSRRQIILMDRRARSHLSSVKGLI